MSTSKVDRRNRLRQRTYFLDAIRDRHLSHGEIVRAAIAEKKNILAAGYTNRLFGILALIEFAWTGSADTLALLQAMQASNGAASVPVGNAAASVRFTFTRRSLIGHKPPGESGCPN